jgi:MYXO-CTERM domain-containing protein
MAATLLAAPLFSQTDPNRPADMTTTAHADNHRDDGFNMGWLGLIGLAGLAGLRRKSSVPVTHNAGDGAARIYPSKA